MKQFIQLRGVMGCGKTSTARSIIARGDYTVHNLSVGKREYPYTYDAKKNWLVTGRYDQNVCGGLDGKIKNKDEMKFYLYKIMSELHPELILFEAVMYGLTYKFAADIAGMCRQKGYTYTGILLAPDFEDVLANINKRNGGKPINIPNLSEKYFRSFTAAEKLKTAGLRVFVENPMKYTPENLYKIVEEHLA